MHTLNYAHSTYIFQHAPPPPITVICILHQSDDEQADNEEAEVTSLNYNTISFNMFRTLNLYARFLHTLNPTHSKS